MSSPSLWDTVKVIFLWNITKTQCRYINNIATGEHSFMLYNKTKLNTNTIIRNVKSENCTLLVHKLFYKLTQHFFLSLVMYIIIHLLRRKVHRDKRDFCPVDIYISVDVINLNVFRKRLFTIFSPLLWWYPCRLIFWRRASHSEQAVFIMQVCLTFRKIWCVLSNYLDAWPRSEWVN